MLEKNFELLKLLSRCEWILIEKKNQKGWAQRMIKLCGEEKGRTGVAGIVVNILFGVARSGRKRRWNLVVLERVLCPNRQNRGEFVGRQTNGFYLLLKKFVLFLLCMMMMQSVVYVLLVSENLLDIQSL